MKIDQLITEARSSEWRRGAWWPLLRGSLVALHEGLRDHFRRARKADVVDGVAVPRTSNADAMTLATLWMRLYLVVGEALGRVDRQIPPALDRTPAVQAWFAALEHIGHGDTDRPFRWNAELWAVFAQLAAQLDAVRVRYLAPQLVATRNAAPTSADVGRYTAARAQLEQLEQRIQLAAWGDAAAAAGAAALTEVRALFSAEWARDMDPARRARMLDQVEALIAQLGRRNGWFPFPVATPGLILEEIQKTDVSLRALGRDIYATFRRPWEEQLEAASARFQRDTGHAPQSADEFRIVYTNMQPAPGPEDRRWKTYQGRFVHEWGEFEREWEAFKNRHDDWWDRMWGQHREQALDYRRDVLAWRERFQALGGSPSTPEPGFPKDEGLVPWDKLVLVGAILAAVVVLPPVINSLGSGRRAA